MEAANALLAERRQALIHGGGYGRDFRMSAGVLGERAFEDRVEYELLQRGWSVTTGITTLSLRLRLGRCGRVC